MTMVYISRWEGRHFLPTPLKKKIKKSKTLLNWQKCFKWCYISVTLSKPWTSVCLHSSCLLPLFIMFSNISTFWSHGPGNLRSTADILSEDQITLGNTSEHSAMSQLHLPQWMIVLHFLLVFFLIVSNTNISLVDVRTNWPLIQEVTDVYIILWWVCLS